MYGRRWADLAPSTHTFDPTRVEAVVRPLLARAVAEDRNARRQVEAAIHEVLVRAYGDWIEGWRWSASEGGGGGPVRGWCCDAHSVFPNTEPDAEGTIRRVVSAVLDWRAYLEQLEAEFAALRAERHESLERDVEHAGARLLEIVLERTRAEDAWYATFARTLGWYLEDSVYEVERVREAVDSVVSGRFESWTAPTEEQARTTLTEAGLVAARADGFGDGGGDAGGDGGGDGGGGRGDGGGGRGGDGGVARRPHDAIAEWTAIRNGFEDVPRQRDDIRWTYAPAVDDVVVDGHTKFIDEVDRTRDPERADRMMTALLLARDCRVGLGVDRLAEWQAIVLGRSAPVELRGAPAYGKQGRELYAVFDRAVFEAALEDANDRKTPVVVRAARVYLDICFFHPFDDGNARAARLALDHVLRSEGLVLRDAAPVFTLARAANDARGAASFAALIARLCGTMADTMARWSVVTTTDAS